MKRAARLSLLYPALLAALCAPLFCTQARAGAYIVANETELDIRSHARNFNGFGGDLEDIRVCIDIEVNAALAIQAEPAVRNVIATFNRFRSLAHHTYASGAAADVPASQYDFESTLLHEMLHAHGLSHPNHADESGLGGEAYYGTKSADGPNNLWNQLSGADGVHGSADDVRGDDVNLHWYRRAVNDPGVLPEVIDETTMARALGTLPAGQLFAANGNRQVLATLGFVEAEAAAVQGARPGEAQRHLQHDDLATLRLARAGMDGIQGTSDDYRSKLVYVGRYSNPQGEACQIPVRFDSTTSFASTSIGSYRITPNHWGIMSARMRFNAAVNWYLPAGANTVTTIVSDLPDASSGTQPITVRVNIAKAAGNPIASHPLGVIEVRDGPRTDPDTAYCTITLAGTANETGECSLLPLAGGHKQLTAEYLGYGGFDASSDTEAHTVTGSVQFSAISSSADPVAVGAPLDIRWTLAPPFGAPPMAFGGSVVVKDAPDCASPASDPAHQCSAVLPANQCRITFQGAGPRHLVLCYAGDGAATPASASLAQNVIAGVATTTSIASVTPVDAAPLTPVTVSVAVNETPGQGGHPAGVVEVRDGPADDLFTTTCQISLQGHPGETGDCTLIPLQAGTRTLSASFAPQGRWTASTVTTPLTVGSLRIARHAPTISRRGQGVTVMVDLDIAPFMTDPQPSGLVTVSDGVDSCQIALPRNECVWYGSTPGVRALTATWAGDVNFPGRTSAPVSQQVVDTALDLELVTTGQRAYVDADGASAGNASALSADGRYAVFLSEATNFVPGDTNGLADVFVRDQQGGLIRRANTSSSGDQANGTCADPAISGNGRYVAFSSLASNLVPGDTNNVRDVFLKDLATGTTVRVSVHADGSQATVDNESSGMPLSISADGRFVAFLTFARLLPRDTNIHSDVYVKDMLTGELDLVSTASDETLANFRNHAPAISPDGRYVAFASQASNFVPQDSTITMDIYLKDRVTRSIRLVSSNAAGTSGGDDASFRPVVSAGGRHVAFMSYAHNLITPDINYTDIYVKDMQTGAIERANTNAAGVIESNDADLPSISADGRYVAFQSKFYGPPPTSMTRIYIKDRQTGLLMRGDRLSNGVLQASGISLAPAISADGRFVSFHSASTGFVTGDVNGLADVYVHQLSTGQNQRAALPGGIAADGASAEASMSRDGRYVVFASAATNLMEDTVAQRQVFIHDRITRLTQRMSRGNGWGNADSDSPFVSANGQWIVYRSAASNLVNNDTNGKPDVFLIHRTSTGSTRLSVSGSGAQTTTGTILGPVTVNTDGVLTVFRASDTTLVAGDTNGFEDVFLHNRVSFGTSLVSANAAGVIGNGHSTQSIISDDGSRVAFTSLATNLLAGDDNGVADIYVKNLADGSVLRASSTAAGVPGNGASSEPSLSSDGRYVAFVSAANNLVADDDNGRSDVFVKDLTSGAIVRANLSATGQQGTSGDCSAPALDSDGRQVGFICTQAGLVDGLAAGTPHAFAKQLPGGALFLLSANAAGQQANAPSSIGPRALADNGLLTFSTAADNLLPGDTQRLSDVFVGSAREVPVAATTTTITAHTPDPVQLGQPYTVSVSVTRAAGSGTGDITGTVNINDGSAFCSATLTGSGDSASASCALLSNSTGTKPLRAAYAGDLNHAPSDAPSVTHVVIAPGAPSAPFIGTVVRGNAQVAVNFLPPTQGGGSPISGYTASCGTVSQTGSASPIIVSGLTNGVAVTCRVRASNGAGLGAWSALSASVTPATVPAAPTSAAATRGNGQVSVTFAAPVDDGGAAILGFIVRCGGNSQPGTASPIVVSGLANGAAVACTVAAVNEVGEGPESMPAASVTPATLPGAPFAVVATRGNGQVSVAFAAPATDGGAGISGYIARCGSASQAGAAAPIVVGGLSNGVAVTCSVAAVNDVGEGNASAPSASVTPATVPDAPTAVVATRGNAQASVAFAPPAIDGGAAISGYVARCGSASQTGTATPIVVGGLSNGVAVSCSVAAVNDVGEGSRSAPSASVTPATVPDAPTAVIATRGNAQASVAFTSPAVDGGAAISSYVARCGSASQTGTTTPIVVSGLSNGVAVTCTVAAVNDVGEGATSAASTSVTPANVPDAPTDVVATRGNAQVSVAFTPPAVDGGSAVTGYTATCGSSSQDGSSSPIVVTGLVNGTPVICEVTARNEIGEGVASAPSASVTPATVPAAPQLTTAVGTANGTGAVLSFTATDTGGSAITGYEARCTPGTQVASGTASPLTVGGLTPGSTYACTVSASNELGPGSASNSVNVTPRIQADLAIGNGNGVDFVRGGSRPDWLVEVHNASGNAVTGARVQMTLPSQLTDLAWICTAQGGGTCPAASGVGTLDAQVNLPAGARVSFLVSATVPRTPEQPLQTTATVGLSGAFNDPQTGNNTATDGPDTVGIFRAGFQ